MASLQDLATELLLDIVEYMDNAPDLSSLSATSRRLHYITNPFLYSLAAAEYPYLLSWACGAGLIGVAEKMLVAGLSPNIPAIVDMSPHYKFLSLSRKSRLTASDHMNVLRQGYGHNTKVGYYFKETSMYDPNLYPDPEQYITHDHTYWFPLHAASVAGSVEIINLLVRFGACLDPPSRRLCRCNHDGLGSNEQHPYHVYWTPLHTALCCDNEATANILLTLGASSNVEVRYRQSNALHWAARGSFLSTASLLLESGSDVQVDAQDPNGATPLMWALGTERSKPMMECLLRHGANLDAQLTPTRYLKANALMQACYNGWYKDAIFLVDAGAMVDPVSRDSPSALNQCLSPFGVALNDEERSERDHLAERMYIFDRSFSRKELDLKLGKLTEQPRPNDIDEAVNFAGMVELTKKLIQSGANVHHCPGGAVHPPLTRAAAAHSVPLVELLLASGSRIDREDNEGLFPLGAAVCHMDYDWTIEQSYTDWTIEQFYTAECLDTVKCLLKHGANPNKTNRYGQTALMRICHTDFGSKYQLEMAKLLVSYGADINLRSPIEKSRGFPAREYTRKMNSSPLQEAFRKEKYDICRYLMDQGAEVSHKNADLRIMLEDYLCNLLCGDEETEMDELFDCSNIYLGTRRADLSAPLRALLGMDRSGWLAKDPQSLWLSTQDSRLTLTKALLDAGASDVSWTVGFWGSCLHNIIGQERDDDTAIIRRLISLGADVNASSGSGSLLYRLLSNNDYYQGRTGCAEKFVELFSLLVDNGATTGADELRCFQSITTETKVWGIIKRPSPSEDSSPPVYDMVPGVFTTDFYSHVRKELIRRYVVENNKIIQRKWSIYGDVAFTGDDEA
ncbi:ankyrin [Hypoxylon sp. FL0543]|nr:ankyrin [Hypoxylon sp. FL0543]